MKVEHFTVVSVGSESAFTNTINNLLASGYEFHGTISFQVYQEDGNNRVLYSQAMVKPRLYGFHGFPE